MTAAPERFPRVFWFANLTELFERAAYYATASFVVIYLGQLGLGDYWPSTLNSLLWTLIYFLPILSGAIADQITFRRALLIAFVLLTAGYFLMGYPVWLGGAELKPMMEKEMTAGAGVFLPVLLGVLLIGVGGSFVKPSILGTAQKVAGTRAALAFSIFYVVVNIGSLAGRGVAYVVRTRTSLSLIFAVAMGAAVVAFFTVLLFYRDVETTGAAAAPPKPKKSVAEILLGMVTVLKNGRFVTFLLVVSGFFFLYFQVYNVLPLYAKRVLETSPAMDIYTMANPLTIVCFQLLITRLVKRWLPIRTIMLGAIVVTLGMLVNVLPPLLFADATQKTGLLGLSLPIAGIFMIVLIAAMAVGEMMASPRVYEYIGAIAPKGQEGLYLGYQSLPIALASIIGGPIGGRLFERYISIPLKEGRPVDTVTMWLIIVAIGIASIIGLWIYDRLVVKEKKV